MYSEYYTDANNTMHGLLTTWYNALKTIIKTRALVVNGEIVGEYMEWNSDGTICKHKFYKRNTDSIPGGITDLYDQICKVVNNPLDITDEEKLLIKLRWGIECLLK